ncbi:MAG: hypothetical protein WC114_10870, partial [Smithellaceae bacterium]
MQEHNPEEGMEKSEVAGLGEICLEDLNPELKTACARAGWPSLVPVQARTIPYLLAGRDVM